MKNTDKKLYEAFLHLLKNKKKVTVSNLARTSGVDRNSIYYRLKD